MHLSKVKLLVVCALTICGGLQAAVYNLDFSQTSPNGIWNGSDQNWGYSLGGPVPSILTITAKTKLDPTDDPLFVTGKAGTIFWGNLGNLDAGIDCKNDVRACVGLGVQSDFGVDKNGNPTPPSGSKGISGDGGDDDEALVFTFSNPPGVDSGSVMLKLIGLNSLSTDNMDNNDVVSLYFEFTPIESPSDTIITPYQFSASQGVATVNFATLAGVPGHTFGSFAVRATEGHFGVGGIAFDPVPEPGFYGLLAAGIAGLYLVRRRRFRKNVA